MLAQITPISPEDPPEIKKLLQDLQAIRTLFYTEAARYYRIKLAEHLRLDSAQDVEPTLLKHINLVALGWKTTLSRQQAFRDMVSAKPFVPRPDDTEGDLHFFEHWRLLFDEITNRPRWQSAPDVQNFDEILYTLALRGHLNRIWYDLKRNSAKNRKYITAISESLHETTDKIPTSPEDSWCHCLPFRQNSQTWIIAQKDTVPWAYAIIPARLESCAEPHPFELSLAIRLNRISYLSLSWLNIASLIKHLSLSQIKPDLVSELLEEAPHLPNLKNLSVIACELNRVPKGIMQLSALNHLFLSNNKLGGLPEWLADMSGLREILIYNNTPEIFHVPVKIRQRTDLIHTPW